MLVVVIGRSVRINLGEALLELYMDGARRGRAKSASCSHKSRAGRVQTSVFWSGEVLGC